MSHPYEARLIANESYQAAVAAGIVDAIVRYRYAVGKKAPSPRQ
jgi:N-acetylmuramoyl-L-alanine amidase